MLMVKITRIFFVTFLLLLFSTCGILFPVRKSPYKTFKENSIYKPFDVIIVPGCPYNGKNWNKIMKNRIYWAKFLYDKGYTKNIIFSGGAVYTPYVESKIMALYAISLGIPQQNIFLEEKAEHTTENVYYSYNIAKEKGFKNIALATDPYQVNNIVKFLNKYKLEIKLLPMQYDTMEIMNRLEPKIIAASALVDTSIFISLKDRESFFKRLRGTKGENIILNKD